MAKKKPLVRIDFESVSQMRKDTIALKHLADLEEFASVPPERGGHRFTDWERGFIKALREQEPIFSQAQRDKLKEIWYAADLCGRAEIDDKPANAFSALSPQRQAEQRAAAAKVKLPWEK